MSFEEGTGTRRDEGGEDMGMGSLGRPGEMKRQR